MNRKMILLAVTTLVIASLACSVNINLPNPQLKTGPTQTDNISVPLSSSSEPADITLEFGAGKLTLQPGAENALVSGTATYNVTDFKPTVNINGSSITIEQGNLHINGIPTINQDVINEWNLSLGNLPMSLTIKAGAYTGSYELGGLSIQKLEINDGAASVNLSFSKPNQVAMTSLVYNTGASGVNLTGLANANVSNLTFRGGAGSYTLNFSGNLQNNMNVVIESGVSSVTLIVPDGTNATVNTEEGLMTVTKNGNWSQNGSIYQHEGSGNSINIQVKMGAGNLKLETGK